MQGKALQAKWYFILAAYLPAHTKVQRVNYKKCCLHGVRKDRQEEIWNMPCVCLFLNHPNVQAVRKAGCGNMLEKVVSNRCQQESIPGNFFFFLKEKNNIKRKEGKKRFFHCWSVDLLLICGFYTFRVSRKNINRIVDVCKSQLLLFPKVHNYFFLATCFVFVDVLWAMVVLAKEGRGWR